MNVLVVGSGGREHALCDAFKRSLRVDRLFCANGNAGIGEVAELVDIKPTDVAALVRFAKDNSVNLTFVGGEVPLSLGLTDAFECEGLRIIGPTQSASRLESSKSFAKDFMSRHGIPTAAYAAFATSHSAIAALESGDFGDENSPVVIKADGLAAGKGVIIAQDRSDAAAAVLGMGDLVGSSAASTIVVEEFLSGKEISLLMFADGSDFVLMPPTRDHKRVGDGDTGPNTGGMGTITDSALLPHDEIEIIIDTIIEPTLLGCISEGFPFRGVLFLGLMMTAEGPKVLEYNVRFGDPETQAILIRLETDLADICEAMLAGTLSSVDMKWTEGSSACVVLASHNYPGPPRIGDKITGLEDAGKVAGVRVFHAGTSGGMSEGGHAEYQTAGGRVLGVTAKASDLSAALAVAYEAAGLISFAGMHYRTDIGRVV